MGKILINYGFNSKGQQNMKENDLKFEESLVTPGDIISAGSGYMRGHGTYMGHNETLYASVLGEIDTVNKLLSVKHFNTKYYGQVGDLVIGRIIDVGMKRWKVDTNSRLDSNLLLSSVNLPGGELRRRSLEDEIHMRDYLQEGDLITAEVQIVHKEGSLSLQTRNLKYGKLGQGLFVKVHPFLIQSSRNHFLNFPFGVSLILGKNGYLWIYASADCTHIGDGQNIQDQDFLDSPINAETRQSMSRLRNVILAMMKYNFMLNESSIQSVYQASVSHKIKELLDSEIACNIMLKAKTRSKLESSKIEKG